MNKIELTQSKFALVDDEDFDFLNQWKWHYEGRYASRWENHKKIYMHKVLIPNATEVDHKDLDKLNNQKSNLRSANRSLNTRNRLNQKNNTSGVRGVNWDSFTKLWRARAYINGKQINIGRFKTLSEASTARNNFTAQYYEGFTQ